MVFIYPYVGSDKRAIIIVPVVCSCIIEAVVYALLHAFFVERKIKHASDKLCDMAHAGDLTKLDCRSIDGTAADLLNAVNLTSDEYARLAQVRKTFVANASHELRTPLTSVQGFLQAVLDGTATDADKEKYLKIAFSETKRLNSLITSMLDLSRLDSGKNPLVLSKFDINDTINEIVANFEPVFIKKTLHVNVDFARETCYVFADKDKIIQVITNLLDNAIKYSPAFSRIVITTTVRDNKVYVTVRDFGYGISKKDQMLIWDTFYMSDKSRSPVKTKGSGLGLSIVKKIIDEHGEVVWVESSRGAGATFIFTLTLFDSAKHKPTVGKILHASDIADGTEK